MIVPEFEPERDGFPLGPDRLVIVGPPGTGKTHAVLEHFAMPALSTFPPGQCLLISFSRAASGELRSRLARGLGKTADHYAPTARTIHSEALRLLKLEGALPDDVQLTTESTRGDPSGDVRTEAQRVWSLARHLRVELAVAYHRARVRDVTLGQIEREVARYEAEKAANKAPDYTDLLQLALDLDDVPLRQLLVLDEAQDSSPLQWALVERWASFTRRVVYVGDPDQAVHRWAGASPERLQQHARSGEVRRLGRSFRVPEQAHSVATALIRQNPGRLDAPYLPAPRPGSLATSTQAEAVNWIRDHRGSVFVLARSKKILKRWASELAEAAVPFANERGPGPLSNPAAVRIAFGVDLLRCSDPSLPCLVERQVALDLLRSLPARGFFKGRKKAETLREVEDSHGEVDLWQVIHDPEPLLCDRLEVALASPGLLRRPEASKKLARHLALIVAHHGREALETKPQVTLTTAHGCKGREASLVVVDLECPGLVWQELVAEDERQLLYVALTRTSQHLVLVPHRLRDLGARVGLAQISASSRTRGINRGMASRAVFNAQISARGSGIGV